MYLYDCVIVSFLLWLVIGIGVPLFRNFGRIIVCVCARGRVRACACVCMCVRAQTRGYNCFATARHRASGFRYLIDFIRARGCACECMRVCRAVERGDSPDYRDIEGPRGAPEKEKKKKKVKM